MSADRLIDGTVLVIGAGKMGGALLASWLEGGLDPANVFVEDPAPPDEIKDLLAKYNIRAEASVELDQPPHFVVLAVKPQISGEVLKKLGPRLNAESLLFSIVAGQPLAALSADLPEHAPIIRAMPNTPVLVQAGMTVMIGNEHVGPAHKQMVETLLSLTGAVAWLDEEKLMDAVTAVSGSGPAYVFHFVECLISAGEREGLPHDLAVRLACETVFGAGKLLKASTQSADELRENVTSRGGTTAAALAVLMEDERLEALIGAAVCAARQRSEDLAG